MTTPLPHSPTTSNSPSLRPVEVRARSPFVALVNRFMTWWESLPVLAGFWLIPIVIGLYLLAVVINKSKSHKENKTK